MNREIGRYGPVLNRYCDPEQARALWRDCLDALHQLLLRQEMSTLYKGLFDGDSDSDRKQALLHALYDQNMMVLDPNTKLLAGNS